jgi:hypothetical protein
LTAACLTDKGNDLLFAGLDDLNPSKPGIGLVLALEESLKGLDDDGLALGYGLTA